MSGELEDIEKIHLFNESLSLLIAKEKGDWFLKEPLEDFVDFTELSRWFRALQAQKLRLISEGPDIQWEEYHLKKPSTVEITFSSGNTKAFSVSEKSSFDGKWFVKKENQLFLGESELGPEVNKRTLDSYRSKKLLHSFGHPLTVKFQRKNQRPLNLGWKGSKWAYLEDKIPLDSSHLNTFWTDLSSLKGNQIAGPITKANLQKFALLKPFVEISLKFEKKETTLLIRFSPVKEGAVYGYTSKRNYILKFSEADFEKILLSKENIRDHGQPFRYKKEEVSQLQLTGGKVSFSSQKKPSPSSEEIKHRLKNKNELTEKQDSEWELIEPKGGNSQLKRNQCSFKLHL